MSKTVWFKCKVCGTEMLLEGEPTMKNILDGLLQLHKDLETASLPLKSGYKCMLYSMEWSLKQIRKGNVGSVVVIEETTVRKEIEP